MNILFKINYGLCEIAFCPLVSDNRKMDLMVKELREALGKTQAEMSADTGMSQATISKIETGSQNATLGTLDTVAGYLGVEVRDLFPSNSPEWEGAVVKTLSRFSDAERKEAMRYLDFLSQRDAEQQAPSEIL